MNVFHFIVLLNLLNPVVLSSSCHAKISSSVCKPYFASIKVSSANLHVGPGRHYKIKAKYTTKGVPVLIDAKYDHWRRITDPDGTKGWLHKNQLSLKRHIVITKDNTSLMSGTNNKTKVLAVVKKNVIMSLKEIRGNWCRVSCVYNNKNFSGWVKKSDTFGTFKGELGTCK